jgi:hypothetical protein
MDPAARWDAALVEDEAAAEEPPAAFIQNRDIDLVN